MKGSAAKKNTQKKAAVLEDVRESLVVSERPGLGRLLHTCERYNSRTHIQSAAPAGIESGPSSKLHEAREWLETVTHLGWLVPHTTDPVLITGGGNKQRTKPRPGSWSLCFSLQCAYAPIEGQPHWSRPLSLASGLYSTKPARNDARGRAGLDNLFGKRIVRVFATTRGNTLSDSPRYTVEQSSADSAALRSFSRIAWVIAHSSSFSEQIKKAPWLADSGAMIFRSRGFWAVVVSTPDAAQLALILIGITGVVICHALSPEERAKVTSDIQTFRARAGVLQVGQRI